MVRDGTGQALQSTTLIPLRCTNSLFDFSKERGYVRYRAHLMEMNWMAL
jgi:hypothetical protein